MAGQRRDFDEVFAVEFGSVSRTVYLICRDRSMAEDIAQDAFVELYRHWRHISGYDRPGAWVRRVAIRMTVRAMRHTSARLDAERRFRAPEVPANHDDEVLRAIRTLSPRQQAAVVLFYFEDAPVAEIAELLGCSTATARVHLHRARVRLAELLSMAEVEL